MTKIKLTKSQQQLLDHGSHVQVGNNNYYFIPYWFQQDTEDKELFEVHSLDKLPKELTDSILKLRR